MKTNYKILIECLCVILFTRCASNEIANSDTVKQSEIYQIYSVSYNEGDKELTATASFRFGGANGTTLVLVKPSNIRFENEEMLSEQNVFSGAFYQMNIQTGIKPMYSFLYTDGEGKKYSNNALIIPLKVISCPKLGDKTDGFIVGWDLPLQNGESITIHTEDKSGGSTSVFTNAVRSKDFKINGEELKNIKPGEIEVYLVREHSSPLENGTHLGGSMHVSYTSSRVSMQLIGGSKPEEEKKDTVTG